MAKADGRYPATLYTTQGREFKVWCTAEFPKFDNITLQGTTILRFTLRNFWGLKRQLYIQGDRILAIVEARP